MVTDAGVFGRQRDAAAQGHGGGAEILSAEQHKTQLPSIRRRFQGVETRRGVQDLGRFVEAALRRDRDAKAQ